MNHQQQAEQFREIMSQPSGLFTPDVLRTQLILILEEVEELVEAHHLAVVNLTNLRAREHTLKELADVVYVAYQYAAASGWDLDEALDRVHESNLSKLDDDLKPIKREDGKVIKGPNYKKPTLIDLV